MFEALVFGIYGNWLISFIDKISFLKQPIVFGVVFWGHQTMAVGLSFSTLLLLFTYSIFKPNAVTRRFGVLLGIGHIVGNYGALFFEGFTEQLFVFYMLGSILFLIIYTIEITRMRLSRRETEK